MTNLETNKMHAQVDQIVETTFSDNAIQNKILKPCSSLSPMKDSNHCHSFFNSFFYGILIISHFVTQALTRSLSSAVPVSEVLEPLEESPTNAARHILVIGYEVLHCQQTLFSQGERGVLWVVRDRLAEERL